MVDGCPIGNPAAGIPRSAGNAVHRRHGNRCGRIRLSRPLTPERSHRAGCATIRPVSCASSRRAPVVDDRCGRPAVRFGPHWHAPESAGQRRGSARARQWTRARATTCTPRSRRHRRSHPGSRPQSLRQAVVEAICGTGPHPNSPGRRVEAIRAAGCRITGTAAQPLIVGGSRTGETDHE